MRNLLISVLLVSVAASLVSGCMFFPPDRTGGSRPESRANPSAARCRKGTARPLSVETVFHALRNHGFTVYAIKESGICSAADAIAELDNIVFEGPFENISQHDTIDAVEGQLDCTVSRRSIYSDHRKIVGGVDKEWDWYWLRYENADCALITRGAGAKPRRMNDLREVFEELKAQNESR